MHASPSWLALFKSILSRQQTHSSRSLVVLLPSECLSIAVTLSCAEKAKSSPNAWTNLLSYRSPRAGFFPQAKAPEQVKPYASARFFWPVWGALQARIWERLGGPSLAGASLPSSWWICFLVSHFQLPLYWMVPNRLSGLLTCWHVLRLVSWAWASSLLASLDCSMIASLRLKRFP